MARRNPTELKPTIVGRRTPASVGTLRALDAEGRELASLSPVMAFKG